MKKKVVTAKKTKNTNKNKKFHSQSKKAKKPLISPAEKQFNTAGPCKSNLHYMLDPLGRIDLEEMLQLIRQERYFILHAPRQSGKTTSLLALVDYLNQQGQYLALYVNVEGGRRQGRTL